MQTRRKRPWKVLKLLLLTLWQADMLTLVTQVGQAQDQLTAVEKQLKGRVADLEKELAALKNKKACNKK